MYMSSYHDLFPDQRPLGVSDVADGAALDGGARPGRRPQPGLGRHGQSAPAPGGLRGQQGLRLVPHRGSCK